MKDNCKNHGEWPTCIECNGRLHKKECRSNLISSVDCCRKRHKDMGLSDSYQTKEPMKQPTLSPEIEKAFDELISEWKTSIAIQNTANGQKHAQERYINKFKDLFAQTLETEVKKAVEAERKAWIEMLQKAMTKRR